MHPCVKLKLFSGNSSREYWKNSQSVVLFGLIYLLTAIGLKPDGSRTVHIYKQTIHRSTKWYRIPIHNNKNT